MQEKHPFDIVLKLVINGEIDPWNVDIVQLADKFLQEIKKMHLPDLRLASKALYAAALLLKMKAQALDLEEETEEEKIKRKKIFGIKRFYTIEEIAHVLKKHISPVIEFKPKPQRKPRKPYIRKKRKTIEIPLFKNSLEDAIKLLEEELDKIDTKIKLSQLDYPNKTQAFVALLFLNYEKKVKLSQKKPFDEILIEPYKENLKKFVA
ncbi:MAG: segregation/condensation protein A [Aquificae bacterium]|nr:segregation/condensation protein A [Aquificota bacterium]